MQPVCLINLGGTTRQSGHISHLGTKLIETIDTWSLHSLNPDDEGLEVWIQVSKPLKFLYVMVVHDDDREIPSRPCIGPTHQTRPKVRDSKPMSNFLSSSTGNPARIEADGTFDVVHAENRHPHVSCPAHDVPRRDPARKSGHTTAWLTSSRWHITP